MPVLKYWNGSAWVPLAGVGPGVPTGGTTNQVLTKVSATDYDTSWQTPAAGGSTAPTWVVVS